MLWHGVHQHKIKENVFARNEKWWCINWWKMKTFTSAIKSYRKNLMLTLNPRKWPISMLTVTKKTEYLFSYNTRISIVVSCLSFYKKGNSLIRTHKSLNSVVGYVCRRNLTYTLHHNITIEHVLAACGWGLAGVGFDHHLWTYHTQRQ